MRTLPEYARGLEQGSLTSRMLIEECLARIEDPAGEGARTFTAVSAETARSSADAHDALRRAGRHCGPFAGIPVAVKDLYNVAGEVTTAGSRVLADAPPARVHAPTIARMLAAGFVLIGRTNMTEFAYSGIGANPHYGTPLNPWDRAAKRIPGGSSSGAAVAVADGMAVVALGSDTGGSCRAPAALCGIVGYKPTARRIPLDGVIPLSSSLDSLGPLGASVACCAEVDAILAGEPERVIQDRPVRGLRLAIPKGVVREHLDADVSAAFDRAVTRLGEAGAQIIEVDFSPLAEIARVTGRGGFSAPEAYAWHRELLARGQHLYDPRVAQRIVLGAQTSAPAYLDILAARRRIGASMNALTQDYDALLMPTCPIVAPRIDELAEDAEYYRLNALLLRNTNLFNFLDRCAISLPCHAPGEPPVGLMLVGETGRDAELLAIASGVETALRDQQRL